MSILGVPNIIKTPNKNCGVYLATSPEIYLKEGRKEERKDGCDTSNRLESE